jgi:hypothetical protein
MTGTRISDMTALSPLPADALVPVISDSTSPTTNYKYALGTKLAATDASIVAAPTTAATRTALTAITSASVGKTVFLYEAGRGGMFEAIATDAAAVAADTGQGVYVAGSGVTWRRVIRAPLDVQWFGYAVANSAATNGTAIANAISVGQYIGVYRILLPPAAVDSTLFNMPAVAYPGNEGLHFIIEGAAPPPLEYNVGVSTYQPSTKATVLRITGAGASGAIGGSNGGSITAVELTLKNLIIRREANPTGPAIDAGQFAGLHLENVGIDTGSITTNTTQPTHAAAIGIIWPLINNSAANDVRGNSFIQGFYTGQLVNEHVIGDGNLTISGCAVGTEFAAANHPSRFARLSGYNNTRMIKVTGSHTTVIDELAIEHANSGAVATPSWQDTVYDLDDASDYLRGYIAYHSVTTITGPDDVFTRNGGNFVRTQNLRKFSQPFMQVNRTADQTGIVSGTPTKISWTNALVDSDMSAVAVITAGGGAFTDYTILVSGLYDVEALVEFEAAAAGTYTLDLLYNGSSLATDIKLNLGASYVIPLKVRRGLFLTKGDVLAVRVTHDSGSNKKVIFTAGRSPIFAVYKR